MAHKNRGATYAPHAMRGRRATATAEALSAVRSRHYFSDWLIFGGPDVVSKKSTTTPILEDRRHLPHAIRDEIYRTVSGTPAEISRRPARTAQRPVPGMLPALYHRFETPRRVPICIRRNDRRRVLFALRKAGKAGRGNRTARWTAKSFVRCK